MNINVAGARTNYTTNFNIANRTALDEATLVRQAMAGEEGALEILFASTAALSFKPLCGCLAIRKMPKTRFRKPCLPPIAICRRFEGRSQFSTWLTRIVINAALMRRRSSARTPLCRLTSRPRKDSHRPLSGLPTTVRARKSFAPSANFPRELRKICTTFRLSCVTPFSCVNLRDSPPMKRQKHLAFRAIRSKPDYGVRASSLARGLGDVLRGTATTPARCLLSGRCLGYGFRTAAHCLGCRLAAFSGDETPCAHRYGLQLAVPRSRLAASNTAPSSEPRPWAYII